MPLVNVKKAKSKYKAIEKAEHGKSPAKRMKAEKEEKKFVGKLIKDKKGK